MKDRVLTSQHGQFELREWDGQNRSGIEPWGDKVLVLVDAALAKTAGGILLPDDQRDRQTLSSTTGVMIALGSDAFPGQGRPVGSRVCFERYAGNEYAGMDGELYRLVSARSIGGGMGMAIAGAKAKAAALRFAQQLAGIGVHDVLIARPLGATAADRLVASAARNRKD